MAWATAGKPAMMFRKSNRGAATVRLLFFIPLLLLALLPATGYWLIESSTEALYSVATEQQRGSLASLKTHIETNPEVMGESYAPVKNPATASSMAARAVPLFVNEARTPIKIDGQADEWGGISPINFGQDQLIQLNTTFDKASLFATAKMQRSDTKTFLFLNVKDDTVVYREISHISIHRNDHVRLAMIDPDGNFQRYTLAIEQPGQVFARVVTTGGRALRPEPRIEGFWRATDDGYQLEIAIDNDLLSNRFSFNIADVDDFIARDIKYLLGNQYTDSADELGYLNQRSAALRETFQRFHLNNYLFKDTSGNVLAGQPLDAETKRTIRDSIYINGTQVGTVELRIFQPNIDEFRQLSYQQLTLVSIVSLLIGLLLAYLLSSRLLNRLARMSRELESVVDDQGRVLKPMTESTGSDEISDLAKRFASITQRLQQYNEYLEHLSRRLAHELRTPVSVVRSSLDHLETRISEDDSRYVERARNGVSRLTSILNSMSEAARLEQSLDKDEVDVFEMTNVVRGCFEGYDNAFPEQPFELSIEAEDLKITGIPELFAQMLDKLIDNAVQFSAAYQPVIVRLTREDEMAVLRITNAGPGLPNTMAEQLFDPMISVREDNQRADSHLGLGLHVARLITEFHGGRITLSNREDREGVVATVRLPLLRLTSKLV
jgi:signal transduction histidine kinase